MKGRCVKLEIEINLYLNINVKRDVNLDYKILNNNNYKELKSYKNKIENLENMLEFITSQGYKGVKVIDIAKLYHR